MVATAFDLFSSPHGDFSFSIRRCHRMGGGKSVFVPSRGFLFFYDIRGHIFHMSQDAFSSPHGDFSFSILLCPSYALYQQFSSPHGDFSFSITVRCILRKSQRVFVPSRGFLFFYPISYSPYKSRAIFIICGANIFKPSECYF